MPPGHGVPGRSIDLGAVTLQVTEAGAGGRPLLLIHGFTGSREDFGDWVEPLAREGWWVVAPDLRGHGDSHHLGEEAGYSLEAIAGDLEALIDHLGWERCCVVGHSMGGMAIQELAIASPQRLERLVLMDTHHGPPPGVGPDVVQAGVDLIRSDGLPALLELLDAFAAEPKPADARVRATRPGYVEWNRSKLDRVDPAMYAAMALALVHRSDRLAELAELAVPTLVLVGEEDAGFLPASRRMAAAIPGASLAVIPDAGHSPQFENPDAWWAAIRSFLHDDGPAAVT